MNLRLKDSDGRSVDLHVAPESKGGASLFVQVFSAKTDRPIVRSLVRISLEDARALVSAIELEASTSEGGR